MFMLVHLGLCLHSAYLTTSIFCCDSTERAADTALHARIEALGWIDPALLEVRLDSVNEAAMAAFSAAQVV